jgi:dihydrofolate reductase
MTDPEWQNATVLSGDPVEEVRALEEQSGQDIVGTDSMTLCHTLIRAGLVDEYRLFVYPVVQGRGRRLSPTGSSCRSSSCSKRRPSEAASPTRATPGPDRVGGAAVPLVVEFRD